MTQMTDTRDDIVSVVERTHKIDAGGAVIGAHFLGRTAAFVLGEEAMLLAEPKGEPWRVEVHQGAILATATDGARVVSAGDDGAVIATDAAGESRKIATDPKRRWIDHVALAADGSVAWSAGKSAYVLAKELREIEAPSTVGGLAFLPKGFRLAIAHYNGATLWFPNAPQAVPERLEWKGSHLGATVSPDGRFLVTTMQEPMLHGWRLADRKHMRMSGYAARVTSVGWTVGGRFLATSGASEIILWPFHSKDGPMGKEPTLLAPSPAPRRSRRLPSQTRRWSPPAMATAWCCWCAWRTARRFWPNGRATRRSPRSPGAPTASSSPSAPTPARPAFSILRDLKRK